MPPATPRSARTRARSGMAAWSCSPSSACPTARPGRRTPASARSTTRRASAGRWPIACWLPERRTCCAAPRRWPVPPPEPPPRRGRVSLVGAGPGDPGLLTVRARELIAEADVILHDRLIPTTALAGARADAEVLFVGKEGGGAAVPQEHTEALMVDRALAGAHVVRLKGGDPFVFGRGGEEAR